MAIKRAPRLSAFPLPAQAVEGDKIIRLPTAPARKVQQGQTKAAREARPALRKAASLPTNAFPFERLREHVRALYSTMERSPELMLMLAIFVGLPDDQKDRVKLAIAEMARRSPCASGMQAVIWTQLGANPSMDAMDEWAEQLAIAAAKVKP